MLEKELLGWSRSYVFMYNIKVNGQALSTNQDLNVLYRSHGRQTYRGARSVYPPNNLFFPTVGKYSLMLYCPELPGLA